MSDKSLLTCDGCKQMCWLCECPDGKVGKRMAPLKAEIERLESMLEISNGILRDHHRTAFTAVCHDKRIRKLKGQMMGCKNGTMKPDNWCKKGIDNLVGSMEEARQRRRRVKIKYAVYPSYVISQNDGDRHFIGYEALIKLYGVNRMECYSVRSEDHELGPGIIALRPRYDGNYDIPKQALKEKGQ